MIFLVTVTLNDVTPSLPVNISAVALPFKLVAPFTALWILSISYVPKFVGSITEPIAFHKADVSFAENSPGISPDNEKSNPSLVHSSVPPFGSAPVTEKDVLVIWTSFGPI